MGKKAYHWRRGDSILRLLEAVNILQEVQERAGAPCLSTARVMAVCTVLVGQFWDTGPCILLNESTGNEEGSMETVEGFGDILKTKRGQRWLRSR